MKHIIELDENAKEVVVISLEDGDMWTDTMEVDDLELLNSDYINEHFGDLQDTAYQKGLEEGKKQAKVQAHLDVCHDIERVAHGNYQKGLDDAWEAVRKIVHMPEGDLLNIFTECYSAVCTALQVLLKYDASEAIAKLKAYEEKQNADEEIKVGDEVEVINSGNKYTITWIVGTALRGFGHDGLMCHLSPKDVRKTGRHFNIDKILEEMRS